MLKPGRIVRRGVLGRENGIAMLTVLMLTIILTVSGVAAITSTSLDIKMAGGERVRESTLNAAEACMSSGVLFFNETAPTEIFPLSLHDALPISSITLPLGTAPGQNPLQAEIMGQSDGNADSADPTVGSTRNAVLTISNYTVNMDIDRLYAKPKSGSSLQFAAGYQGTGGGAAGGGIEILYRIDCYANSTAGGIAQAAGHVAGVYACVSTGESCQRKI